MNNKEKQKIVEALINAGKGFNLNPLANTLSWVQFEIPGVNSTEDDYSGVKKPPFRNGGNRQTGTLETALAA